MSGQVLEEPARHYLDVPFGEKDAAKQAGARWDKRRKAWFAPAGADMAGLSTWDTTGGAKPVRVAQSPQAEFAAACKANGLLLDGLPVMDGAWRRVKVEGDRKAEKSGSYRGFLDGRPSGQITNFRGDGVVQWVAAGAQKRRAAPGAKQAVSASSRAVREQDEVQRHEEAAKRAYGAWMNAPWLNGGHPYLAAKEVKPWGVKAGRDGVVMVPIRDVDGKIQSLQFIAPDGGKRMMAGGRKSGCFHVIDPKKRLGEGPLVIAEGYATAATIFEATGRPTVVAFDAGNLRPVAEALRGKYPQAEIVIAGDDDCKRERNIGREAAESAARAVGGEVASPAFDDEDRAKGLTDFNDLARVSGTRAVSAAITVAFACLQERQNGQDSGMGI